MNKPNLSDLLSLSGRRALVTGGSGNIGRGIALRLAEAGADVAVHYFHGPERAKAVVEEVTTNGVRGLAVAADLKDAVAVDRLFQELKGHDLLPDIVVNNAGLFPVATVAEMTTSQWQETLSANLDGPFLVTQKAAAHMRSASKGGAIINIASIEGLDPAPGHSHYAASKAAVIMFTRACAVEFGADGIRVNAVSPGLIHRPGIEEQWPEGVARWQSLAPLSRLGSSQDIADAVLFLASPAARWINGTNLVVDGGMSARSKW